MACITPKWHTPEDSDTVKHRHETIEGVTCSMYVSECVLGEHENNMSINLHEPNSPGMLVDFLELKEDKS